MGQATHYIRPTRGIPGNFAGHLLVVLPGLRLEHKVHAAKSLPQSNHNKLHICCVRWFQWNVIHSDGLKISIFISGHAVGSCWGHKPNQSFLNIWCFVGHKGIGMIWWTEQCNTDFGSLCQCFTRRLFSRKITLCWLCQLRDAILYHYRLIEHCSLHHLLKVVTHCKDDQRGEL